jgi:hypothetical protein
MGTREREKMPFNDIFFKYFFPSIVGKAKLMDEYNWDQRLGVCAMVTHDNIIFHQPDGDLDWLVKICIILMIAASLEVQSRLQMLWKQGQGYGLKEYPNFAQ